jgi:hypothetical protein
MTVEEHLQFKYKSLDVTKSSIRVLSIHPQLSIRGLLQCSIQDTTIDAQYICLSYRWGSTTEQHTILVDGKQLQVTKNLHDFLHEARLLQKQHFGHVRKRHLTTNAVCIDQSSIVERNHQVA